MKPTQIVPSANLMNQVPGHTTVRGDIRVTPFYSLETVKQTVEGFVAEINADLTLLAQRGPCSKYVLNQGLPDELKGLLALSWGSQCMEGVACDIDSPGFNALKSAAETVKGKLKPWSSCSPLPFVKGMQLQGFDIQITGFGVSSVHHDVDEYCLLNDMEDGFKVLHQICCNVEKPKKQIHKNKDLY